MRRWWLVPVVLLLLLFGWYTLSPLFRVVEMHEVLEEGMLAGVSGDFVASAHAVSGKAVVYDGEERVLRFEGFETVNGPDLRVYLAADLAAEDFVDLGELKATKGEIQYVLPEGVDLSHYRYVLIWCRAFSVLFSFAELQ